MDLEIACFRLAKHIANLRQQIHLVETAMIGLETGAMDIPKFLSEARAILETEV